MGPRGVGNSPHSSLPPPRPPDPSQFKLKLQAHREEISTRFSELCQSMTAIAAEQEEFRRELREELRQLRLSYGEPALPQPHSNPPTTVSAPLPSSIAGNPSSPSYYQSQLLKCQLPQPSLLLNCKPQSLTLDPKAPRASFHNSPPRTTPPSLPPSPGVKPRSISENIEPKFHSPMTLSTQAITKKGCVGVGQHNCVEPNANDHGNRTTPSYVAFTDTEVANDQFTMNPMNTIFDANRLIGRRFSDSSIQGDMNMWSFKVVLGPCVVAKEISYVILIKMREIQVILEGLKIGKGHELENYFSGVDKRVRDKGGGHTFQLGNNPKVTTTMSHDPQYWKNGFVWGLFKHRSEPNLYIGNALLNVNHKVLLNDNGWLVYLQLITKMELMQLMIDKAFEENGESMGLVLVQFDRENFYLVVMNNRRFKASIFVFSKLGEQFVATVLLNKMEREGNIIAALAVLVKYSVKYSSGCIKNGELEQSCKEFGHVYDEWVKEVYQGAFDNYLNTLKGFVSFKMVSIYESLEGWLGSYFASMVTAVEQSEIFIYKQESTLKQMDLLGLSTDVGMLIFIHANFTLFVSMMAHRNLELDALMNVLSSLRKCKKIRSYYSSSEDKVGGLLTGLHIIVPYSIYWNDSMLEEHDKGLRPYYLHCVANNVVIRSGRFKFVHNGLLLLLAMLFTNNGTLHQFREYNALALCILDKLYESMYIEGAEKLMIIKAQKFPQALFQGMMLCKNPDQDAIILFSLMLANYCLEARYLSILTTSMVSVGTETTVHTFLDGNLQIHQLGTQRVNTVKAYTATFSHVMNKNSIAVSGINSGTISTCSLVISNGAFEVISTSQHSLGEEDSNHSWLYFILKLGLVLGQVMYTSRMQLKHEHVIGSNINQIYNPNCGVKWVRVVYICNQPSSSSIEVVGFLKTVLELSHWRYGNITWFLLLNLCTWLRQSLQIIIHNEITSTTFLRFLMVNFDSLPEQHHNCLKVACDLEGMMLFDEDGPMPNTHTVHEVDCQLQDRNSFLALLKQNLHKAQERMKLFHDKLDTVMTFEVGNLVYLILQSYKQQSVEKRTVHNLLAKYYGPFEEIEIIGTVAKRKGQASAKRLIQWFGALVEDVIGMGNLLKTSWQDIRILNLEEEVLQLKLEDKLFFKAGRVFRDQNYWTNTD